jgi:transposase-like protein
VDIVAQGLSRSRPCGAPASGVAVVMTPPDYAGYRFPSDAIQRAVWMYLRFTLSYRDVEDLLAERGVEVSYETIRRWVTTFGPVIACRLRAQRPVPHRRWHLDEMFVRIGGKQMYLWRAVDAEGEVLEVLVQARRDAVAARKLIRKLLRKQGIAPTAWVTDVRLTARRFVICGSPAYPTYGPSGKTTGPRVRTFRFDDASGRDKDSNRPPRHSGSCRFMPPPTTHSMSAVTSPPPARIGSFEPRRSRHGVMRLASRPELGECGPHRGHARQCDKPRAQRCRSLSRQIQLVANAATIRIPASPTALAIVTIQYIRASRRPGIASPIVRLPERGNARASGAAGQGC